MYTPDSPSLCAIYPILLPSSISSPFLLPCHFKEHPYLHCYIFFRFFFALQRISMPNYIFHTFFSLLFFSDSIVTYSQQEPACNLIIRQLVTMPVQGICQGGQPIISYNFGANNKKRVKEAFFTQFKACIFFMTLCWAVLLLVPQIFAGMFSNAPDLIQYTARALRIYMAGIFSIGFQVSCQQSFMALGQAKISLLLACLRKLILLIPLIFILPLFLSDKVFAVFLAEPVSYILAAAITTITFLSRFNGILNQKDLSSPDIR